MKNIVWDLFKRTGSIGYFLLNKELSKKEEE